MARGLAIYTGNIWEAYDKQERISSSIGSGGRYDKVIGEYTGSNEEIPAVGVSFGLVPMLTCLEKEEKQGVTQTLIVPLEEELLSSAFSIAQKLRAQGKNTEVFYGFKLKKAFDYADYLGVEELAILGKKDLEAKQFTLKNLQTKEEEKISL